MGILLYVTKDTPRRLTKTTRNVLDGARAVRYGWLTYLMAEAIWVGITHK